MRSLRAGVGQRLSPQPSGMSGLVGQSLIDYLGTHLRVTYVRSASGGSDVVLTNSGPLDIPPGAHTTVWSIYFSHATYGKNARGLKTQYVKMQDRKRREKVETCTCNIKSEISGVENWRSIV